MAQTTPEIGVAVTANIAALEAGMAQAEATVANTANILGSTMDRAGQTMFEKFDGWMKKSSAGIKRLGLAIGGISAAARAATGDIEGAFSALPGVFGMVGGAAFGLGKMLGEKIFGSAQEELEKFKKELAELDRISGFKTQARDAERLTEIEKETNALAKIELQRRNELAKVRQSILTMETEGAVNEAAAAIAAQERLINAKADAAVKAEMQRMQEVELAQQKELAEAEKKRADEAQKAAEAKKAAQQRAKEEEQDIVAQIGIMKEQDEVRKIELELELKLTQIRRDRAELTEKMGKQAADSLILHREELEILKAQQDISEIEAQREEERQKASTDALKDELKAKQDALKDLDKPMSLTQSITTSIGGSFAIANQGAMSAMKTIGEQQKNLQQRIAELVAQIATKVGSAAGGIV